jgi:hypothetical protein
MKMKNHSIIILLFCALVSNAQFKYRGVGIFGALNTSAHKYRNLDTDKKTSDSLLEKYFFPQTHISKEYISWGAGIFLEMGAPRARWQTELEYTHKGAKEMALTNIYTGDRTGVYVPNKYTYIQWNNYLKYINPLGIGQWYWMAGVRLEYLFKSAPVIFLPVSAEFPKFWFSGDLGAGYEFPIVKKFSGFFEFHWNPDIIAHKHDNTKIRNRTFELRVGLVMRPKKKSIDDCNAPVYRGPAY